MFILCLWGYRLFIRVYYIIIWVFSFFNKKATYWIKGRKVLWEELTRISFKDKKTIWFHCASLGEFEQGFPLLQQLKKEYPSYFFIVTFFSPSGYNALKYKVTKDIDAIFYLPLDTKRNMKKMVEIINPQIVIIIKYEYWYNFLKVLFERKIPIVLISALFLERQIFFQWYGKMHQKMLTFFSLICVQNKASQELLEKHFKQIKCFVCGDTRFDRVRDISKKVYEKRWDWIGDFKQKKELMVVGSSWQKDEEMIAFIKNKINSIKYIIAPHEINKVQELKKQFSNSILLTEMNSYTDISLYQVIIIDYIGMLSQLYNFADYVYVGGGFTKSGIHNILEAAAYGKLIFIGPNFNRYNEAVELNKLKGLEVVRNEEEFLKQLFYYQLNKISKSNKELITKNYVQINAGVSEKIIAYIKQFHLLREI